MDKNQWAVEIDNAFLFYDHPRRVPWFKSRWLKMFRHFKTHRVAALNDISVRLRANRITGLIGRNGSGKTSLIKLMTGTRYPSSGSVKVFGLPPKQSCNNIGICFGGTLIYHRLTARQNLEYFAGLYNVPSPEKKIEELAEMLGIHKVLDEVVETYSFGMKTKLAIARSLIHDPKLLILDEPTLGIDIFVAREIRQFVRNVNATVLLTSHYVEEIDQLADDLLVIEHGKILDHGTQKDVLKRARCKTIPELFERIMKSSNDPNHVTQLKKAS